MKVFIITLSTIAFLAMSCTEQTPSEKADATANSAERALKEGVHRAEEAVCGTLTGDNKVECLAKEAKNRLEEGKDNVVDKSIELKNAVDSDAD